MPITGTDPERSIRINENYSRSPSESASGEKAMMRIVHQFFLLVKYLIVAVVGGFLGFMIGYLIVYLSRLFDPANDFRIVQEMFKVLGILAGTRYYFLRYENTAPDQAVGATKLYSQIAFGLISPLLCLVLCSEAEIRVEFNILFTILSLILGVALGTVVHILAIRGRDFS